MVQLRLGGGNEKGQLGTPTNSGTTTRITIPTTIPDLEGVKQIFAGDYFTVALLEDGTVKAWGTNYFGQLGNTTTSRQTGAYPTPTNVEGLVYN